MKVHVSTLSNEQLKLLIIKTVTKRGLSKNMIRLLIETYSLLLMIDKGWIDDQTEEGKELVIRNITHVTDDYVIKPVEGK